MPDEVAAHELANGARAASQVLAAADGSNRLEDRRVARRIGALADRLTIDVPATRRDRPDGVRAGSDRLRPDGRSRCTPPPPSGIGTPRSPNRSRSTRRSPSAAPERSRSRWPSRSGSDAPAAPTDLWARVTRRAGAIPLALTPLVPDDPLAPATVVRGRALLPVDLAVDEVMIDVTDDPGEPVPTDAADHPRRGHHGRARRLPPRTAWRGRRRRSGLDALRRGVERARRRAPGRRGPPLRDRHPPRPGRALPRRPPHLTSSTPGYGSRHTGRPTDTRGGATCTRERTQRRTPTRPPTSWRPPARSSPTASSTTRPTASPSCSAPPASQVGDHVAFCLENHPRFLAARLGRDLRRPLLHGHQQPPHHRGGRLHRRRLRRPGVHHLEPTSADLAADLVDQMPEVRVRLMIDGTVDGYESYEDAVAGYPAEPGLPTWPTATRQPDRRQGHALLARARPAAPRA